MKSRWIKWTGHVGGIEKVKTWFLKCS